MGSKVCACPAGFTQREKGLEEHVMHLLLSSFSEDCGIQFIDAYVMFSLR